MQDKIAKIRKLKLLFVEDEKDLIDIISDTLNKLQLNFLTAYDGAEALKIIEENQDIDLVITDINMPNMDGLELIENINNKYPKLKVIIMSAYTESEYLERAKDLGIDDYLLKPFDFIKFIELISSMEFDK
jgi:YesN/AraC family two-component response regulator